MLALIQNTNFTTHDFGLFYGREKLQRGAFVVLRVGESESHGGTTVAAAGY
jgi:hypothetical protein